MKSKEATPKRQKAQHPTTENTKVTSSRPRDRTTSTKKTEQTQPDLSALTTRGHSTKITLPPHNPAEGT